mgnify:CR=1 FL=1
MFTFLHQFFKQFFKQFFLFFYTKIFIFLHQNVYFLHNFYTEIFAFLYNFFLQNTFYNKIFVFYTNIFLFFYTKFSYLENSFWQILVQKKIRIKHLCKNVHPIRCETFFKLLYRIYIQALGAKLIIFQDLKFNDKIWSLKFWRQWHNLSIIRGQGLKYLKLYF